MNLILHTLVRVKRLNKRVSLACKERKYGGTSASRDENGQVDVWR